MRLTIEQNPIGVGTSATTGFAANFTLAPRVIEVMSVSSSTASFDISPRTIALSSADANSASLTIAPIVVTMSLVGSPGAAGESAYQTWVGLGNDGDEHDFIQSLSSGGLPLNYTQAMDAADEPSAINPFVTTTASETAITTQRVDYDALVAATLSI